MNYTTDLNKGRDGWRAQTYITLSDVKAHAARDGKPGETKLSIRTSKHSRGGLSSYASVAFHGEQFTTHAMGLGTGLGDYDKTILHTEDRCTEKAVARLHAEALKLVFAVLEEVRLHYAAQEVRRAAEARA